MEWGKGLVQKKDKEDRKSYEEAEKYKPFARTIEDEDLNEHYKDKDRWGDPMANLVSKDKKEKKTKREFKPAPRWRGAPPANRFNILPGWRWDGVDRSNGFELKVLSRESTKKAEEEQAYLWSVEDM